MKIIDGKWQDAYGDPVDELNVSQLLEIGENVQNVYGEDITYSRIELISAIKFLVVAFQFMELKNANSFWKVSLILVLTGIILIVLLIL